MSPDVLTSSEELKKGNVRNAFTKLDEIRI